MAEPVGLVPCAGSATRLGRLSLSKEVYPLQAGPRSRPRPAICWLLEAFRRAGARRAVLVVRAGKWDIPGALGSGGDLGLDLAYVVVEATPSIPHTLAAAAPWLAGATVLFGFPDILFRPQDSFRSLLRHHARGAEAVLGLVPGERPERSDVVDAGPGGRLRSVAVKPGPGRRGPTWVHAVWSSAFTERIGRFVAAHPTGRSSAGRELYPGDVFAEAARAGAAIDTLPLRGGGCLDIGTPAGLAGAAAFLAEGRGRKLTDRGVGGRATPPPASRRC